MKTNAPEPVVPPLAPEAAGSPVRALVIVDMQNDFMEGGPLGVPGARALVPLINRLQRKFAVVVATSDWHPPGHVSFAASHDAREPGEVIDAGGVRQILWPTHCVQETLGADVVDGLETERWATVVRKGEHPLVDSYSGYFDNAHGHHTGLNDFLRTAAVEEVYLVGVATEYCVRFTAQDALSLGFQTTVIADACRAVNLQPGDEAKALQALHSAGVRIAKADEVLAWPEGEMVSGIMP